MARRRYPSDWPENRNKRPSVRVHLTWVNHPQYAEVCADPVLRGVVLGIWMVSMRAFACQTGDTVTLTAGDVEWITGGVGRDLLRAACEAMHYEMHEGARCVRVQVRNLSKKQGFTPQNSGVDSVERNADSAGASDSDSDSYESSSSSSPVGVSGSSSSSLSGIQSAPVLREKRKPVKKAKTPPPASLDLEERAQLDLWATTHGFTKEQVSYAITRVWDWAAENAKVKASWTATIRNAMRAGWGLEGYTNGNDPNGSGPPGARRRPPRFETSEERNLREIDEWIVKQRAERKSSEPT